MTDQPDPAPRKGGRPGLFLARDSYRQRRLRDAARMLPVLGTVIWLIPLLWRRDAVPTDLQTNLQVGVQAGGGTAAAVVFVFAGWVVLIVLAALIARRLRPDTTATADGDPAP